jgi:hypothetical protein
VALDTEELLRQLKAVRDADPGFERAIAEFAQSEAAHASEDPAEGKLVTQQGPVQSRVRELLAG